MLRRFGEFVSGLTVYIYSAAQHLGEASTEDQKDAVVQKALGLASRLGLDPKLDSKAKGEFREALGYLVEQLFYFMLVFGIIPEKEGDT